jgi:HD-GYP domain-containing protein (c-di-GMP phosphodiesterase class II)
MSPGSDASSSAPPAPRLSASDPDELGQLRAIVGELRAALVEQEQESASQELQLQRYAADLRETFKQERSRAQELQQSYIVTVRALSNAVEARDAYTAKHAERVAAYGLEIARAMDLQLVADPATEFGFLLHDVGKVAITDAILHKPGPLTSNERALMQQHPAIGAHIVADIPFLAGDAAAVIRSHHERWDGGGYPDGLAGTAIPLPARIFSVADVLDALTTTRPYRTASPIAEARARIAAAAGTHFDPTVVEAFGGVPDEVFAEIGARIR